MNLNKDGIAEWAECHKEIVWIDEIPWRIRNKMLLPLSMPHTIKNVNREKVREELKKTNALLAHWSTDWDRTESEWWWTCCDHKNYSIENIESKNGRRGIQKGITACTVSRIEPENFTDVAYNIYSKALKSYDSTRIPTKEEYNQEILEQSKYKGYEIWGSFIDGQLAAFTTCAVVNNAVSLGSTKSDADFHKFYPNNALFYQVTKHYLQERNVLYITNGYRTLLHPTTINDFLIRIGYRKVFCHLNLELSNSAKILINSRMDLWIKYFKIFKKKFPDQLAKMHALLKIYEISKSFN